MQTITIKATARSICTPLTVNRLIGAARSTKMVTGIFWPRLVADKTINSGKRIGVKVDDANLEYLRELKRRIRAVYGIFVSYSMMICVLGMLFGKPPERRIVSLNVKGYKAGSKEFRARLMSIASVLVKELPDIVFLQEFKAGEEDVFLKVLRKELKGFYEPVMPRSYKKEEEYSFCTCIVLVRRDLKCKTMRLKEERTGFKLRYNLLEIEDYVFLNAWIPQTFDNQDESRIGLAEAMWSGITDTALYYSGKRQKFFLVGDLNASINGVFEEKIVYLNQYLRDTKIIDDATHPTGIANVLDYAFANRYAVQSDMIRTRIMEPSFKDAGLSDHDALLTTFIAV